MAANRPYAQLGIVDLERLVQEKAGYRPVIEGVLAELKHRKVARAQALQRIVERHLAALPPSETKPASLGGLPSARPTQVPPPHRRPAPLPGRASVTNAPQDILSAWTVLEVLSPATFRRPADLAGGDLRRVARFERGLPWAQGDAKGPPGARLYFQVVLGSIEMRPAIDQLLERFSDARPERPQARGETPLAVIIVDRDGRPVPEECAVVSSFGWGLPLALADDPALLSQWQDEENRIEGALHDRLCREGRDGRVVPLDEAAILSAYDWLVAEFGLDRAMLKPPSFAVRSTVPFKSTAPPEPLLLNSFFLKDLAKARRLFKDHAAPDTLRRFLGDMPPRSRRDLLHDEAAVEAVVAPALFPAGRWPGPDRHPLVLMQQAAVNLATAQAPGEILAVNGPPGTGKTTLLRDVVAALVTERASAMAAFDDPETAFSVSGEKLKPGGAWVHLYRLDPRLKGFEMLVASSNNKAVENVSGELPALNAVAKDATRLRYFKPLADGLLDQENWGAIAGVLGNASNRAAFKDRFWWTPDTGLFSYLKAVDGRKPEIDLPGGGKRPPRIVAELDPPVERREALGRWRAARAAYLTLEDQVAETRARVELFRLRCRHLPPLARAFENVRAHGAERPGLIQRMFHLSRYRSWKAKHQPLSAALAAAGLQATEAKLLPASLARWVARSPWLGFGAEGRGAAVEAALQSLLSELQRDREQRTGTVVDDDFFASGRERIQPAAPWFAPEEHRQRDDLFQAALDLHRAFIDAAAKPLRQNLGAALQVLDGKGFSEPSKDALIPDLWSSLFLVVPVLSTTFASVGTMLGRLPPASLGWLLVDEAGQAAPQQAVGALLRASRAIVVGDPIQVPPVVLLPDRLTAAVCRTFGVEADRFAAPAASVQTLADDATAWFAEFPARLGSRTVGVPLLVHRRCSEPMFGIANRVAYENLMVQAKAPRTSAIRDLLGPSRWIDIAGAGSDKWCAAEGREALGMIEQIVAAGLTPDLYVVTPFVQVADGLRTMIRESATLAAAIPALDRWAYERVGTIHTVQGREAEAVIFVLGAPNADQTGARGWAGKEPNLLNVAMTRAKEVVYVVGNRTLWRSAGVFGDLDSLLPPSLTGRR
ncbi:ATP-binding protein [Phenylobacterium sp.]|uniref:DEAD/DEAH box helicase n=1 Tax=Phenylobacterium sp. TaxID=1871053 RepID=UPI00301D67BA